MANDETKLGDNLQKFVNEFVKESDRACVILAAAKLDSLLEQILKIFFRPIPSSDDTLFDGPFAPLSNLSARIDFAFRLGIINMNLCRIFHLVRKIRNEFAHGLEDCNFEKSEIKNRVGEVTRELKTFMKPEDAKKFGNSPRNDYSLAVAFLIGILSAKLQKVKRIDPM